MDSSSISVLLLFNLKTIFHQYQMNISQLEKQIETLTDQINDIFHATELNFDAIKIHLQIEPQNQSNQQKTPNNFKNNLISQCEKQFKNLKAAYKERSNLRLQYLINEQIKSQEQKVRRQRLLEYQDKIYDHRRLINDKENFYDSLLKPKIKKPMGMTNEQFQELRIRQARIEEKKNLQQLQEQTQLLLKLEKVFRNHRVMLEDEFQKYKNIPQEEQKVQNQDIKKNNNKAKQILKPEKPTCTNEEIKDPQNVQQPYATKQQQRNRLIGLAESTPILYSQFQMSQRFELSAQNLKQAKKLLQECFSISQNEKQLLSQYKEEREMYRYLKWEQVDLVKKYKKLQEEIKELRSDKKEHKRKISD